MTLERDESAFVGHEPCPECGSRDNMARYASGRGHCHGCGYNDFPEGMTKAFKQKRAPMSDYKPIEGVIQGLTKVYGTSEDTNRKLGIRVVTYAPMHAGEKLKAKKCLAFDYRTESGALYGQKIRYSFDDQQREELDLGDKDKTFGFPNAGGSKPLWLQHLWPKGTSRKSLMVMEGEGDAAAYYQVTKGEYPVVSIPTGAKGFKDSFQDNLGFLQSFGEVVLCFDGDDTGRAWAENAAEFLLKAGVPVKIGEVRGHKDARAALMAGDAKAITAAFFTAERYRPEGIFKVKDLIEEARKPVAMGIPWWSETLTKWTFGRRKGELYTLGAGNSIGKTDWTTQSIAYDALVLKIMTAVIYLEQPPVETLKRLAGKKSGKPFHIPMEALKGESGEYTQEELDEALDELEDCPTLIFGGNFASTEWDEVEAKIRYLVAVENVEIVYLDNLTALIDTANERQSVEQIIKEMALLCQELGIIIVLLCHLSTPDGKSHEEGGQVSLKHFKGSRAMGAWPHYAFGLERNTQHEDESMRNYSIFRCVKDRYTGRANGNTMCLRFDKDSGQLIECEVPEGLFSSSKNKNQGSDKSNEDPGFAPIAVGESMDDVPF